MNSQETGVVDVQSAEAKYHDLVIRIKAAIEGENEDRKSLFSVLSTIQKKMARTLSRIRRHVPSRKHRLKYDAYVNSFALTFKVLDQALQSLSEHPNNSQYTTQAMPTDATLDLWQDICDDLADTAVDAERNRTKQRRENINRVLDFLDALDRLLDGNTAHEHFLEHVLEMFRLMRIEAHSNLRSIGLEKIASSVGNPLDPIYCEVVDTESTENGSEPKVQKQIRSGYTLDGKVFRKAAVIVGDAE